MINRTEEIQKIIDANGFKSYLEIGLGNGVNFKAIKCEKKIGVDPDVKFLSNNFKVTSDKFFEQIDEKYDLIFLDGLHHSDQVGRDIVNAWNCLNKGGIIVIHDVKPLDEVCQRVPRESVAWTGDVWRAWYGLKKAYPKLNYGYIDERTGLGLIYKSKHKIELGFVDNKTTYQEYHNAKGWEVK